MGEESKIKILGEENFRLLEVLKLTREGVAQLDKRNRELKAMADAACSQTKVLEQKCAERESEIARLAKSLEEKEKALAESESVCAAVIAERERLENENLRLSKDLAKKTAEEARFVKKIHELEAEKESETQAGREAMAKQAEANRLVIEEHEARYRQAEETRQKLESEKKALSAELTEKKAEESRLRSSLQEAGEALEKLNTRILELEKDKQAALELDVEKTASLASLKEIKERLEEEKDRLRNELEAGAKEAARLKDEIHRLTVVSGQRQDEIQALEREKLDLGKDLAAKNAEEARLIRGAQGLKAELVKKESEINACHEAMAQMEQQMETHRIAVRGYEAGRLRSEEAARNFEKEKKDLTEEIAEKTAEELKLRAGLQEAAAELKKMNARIRKLEEEKQIALELAAEKSASLETLKEVRERLENEKERLKSEKERLKNELEIKSEETSSLTNEIRALEGECAQKKADIQTLEKEKLNLAKDLEAKNSEEVQLLGKIRGLEAESAQKASKIKASQESMAQSAEAHRLAIEEHETRHRRAEEAKRSLEEKKETLALKLAEKTIEESRLRVSLHEAEDTLEKLNARVLELKGELQKADNNSKILQSEKERLEEAREASLKSNAEKDVLIARVESEKKLLENERKRLLSEKEELEAGQKHLDSERQRLEKTLEERSMQANAQSENFMKRCADLEGEINQMRNERDEKIFRVEELTRTIEKMTVLLKEEEAARVALEEKLGQEKKMRAEVQAHSKDLEVILHALEKKINDIA